MQKNKTTSLIAFILISIFGSIGCRAAENARSVLKHAVDRMKEAPVEAKFAVIASGMNGDGTITLSGNKFEVKTDDLSTWYDGKTQWTLARAINEVNVSNPTPEELAEINPLIILSNLSSRFNVDLASSTGGIYEIVLQSKSSDAPISSARVRVNGTTWFPASMDIMTTTGQVFRIEIKSIKNINSVNDSMFRFNPKAYPGVEVIDLR